MSKTLKSTHQQALITANVAQRRRRLETRIPKGASPNIQCSLKQFANLTSLHLNLCITVGAMEDRFVCQSRGRNPRICPRPYLRLLVSSLLDRNSARLLRLCATCGWFLPMAFSRI
jgi:hypothetical protein